MVQAGDDRWVEVSPSQFTHEAEGLALVRAIMPDETPFRAWSNFEFRDNHGRWHEVDLLLLGRGRLHLIELKYYSGVLRGDDHRWLRDGKRPEDSPLKLARRKAQYFATKLRDELRAWAQETKANIPDERDLLPFVQESVFLHHPQFTSKLSDAAAMGLYGLDGAEEKSNLWGISELVLEPAGKRSITLQQERLLTNLMSRIGLVQRRQREAGSWVIEDESIDSGDGWQDWLATHKVVQQDRARIRFQVLAPSATTTARADVRRIAEHEFRLMGRLHHDGILQPRDLVESELGVGLVYPYAPEWERLDLWMAGQENGVPLETQLSMVRQIGEALQYAHSNKVVHRGLSPKAVWVREVPGTTHDVKVRLGDWQGAGTVAADGLTRSSVPGVTSLFGIHAPTRRSDATSASSAPDTPDADGRIDASFQAPEGVWNAAADRVRLDVFGLGAVAFYLLTGTAPAPSASALISRLQAQQGLDLSVELPQISSDLRSLVLKATHPSPSQRTPDVSTVLTQLSKAERETASDLAQEDPLEAHSGAVLDGRFELVRRLGQGSTAVGLLVIDRHASGSEAQRVLKVALNDEAASRLTDEAEVLRSLDNPRVVKVIEGPIVVGGRPALLLENAGAETLTEVLRTRSRLSLDLLERFGVDLLDGMVVLDKAGVDHRDIKPSNLGVRENRGDRTKHLVLFDFSLTRAAASATSAGTPPYLDPFLTGARDRYDSAAERYAAAVVLFEMATGATPVYGDRDANPAAVQDEATVTPEMFDPALAEALVGFFRTALARDAARRHDTAESMRSAWLSIFAADATTEPDASNDELARTAMMSTPLAESGLTARALSALEPYAVTTVGELLTVDPVRLSRMQGVANATRLQISARMKEWRERLGDARESDELDGRPPTPAEAADLFLSAVASKRAPNRGAMVRLVLGVGTDLEAFATHAQLAAHLPEPVTTARGTQILSALQEAWASDDRTRRLLDLLADAASTRLTILGGVATPGEVAEAFVGALSTSDDRDERLVLGLLRFALERRRALNRAGGSADSVWLRRRDGKVTLLAEDQALFEVAEVLGGQAEHLVQAIDDPRRGVVAAAQVRAKLAAAVRQHRDLPDPLTDPMRLAQLAAAMSASGAVTGGGELHHRGLTQVAALELTFKDFGGGLQLGPVEIRDRVSVRFPSVPELPQRPTLDALVQDAGLGLVYDDRLGIYRSPKLGATTGLESRQPTSLSVTTSPVGVSGAIGARLEGSIASRSFLALGVRADRLTKFVLAAEAQYAARVVDVTGVLLDALRAASERTGLPWELVRAADAESETSRGRRGLNELVKRSWSQVEQAVDSALETSGSDAPVLLTEASPLARYDNMGLLAKWTDLGASRQQAVWLVVPQLASNHGPLLDGRPVPLAAPSQYVALDNDWIDSAATVGAAAQKEQ